MRCQKEKGTVKENKKNNIGLDRQVATISQTGIPFFKLRGKLLHTI
jgi:hypothetical protein